MGELSVMGAFGRKVLLSTGAALEPGDTKVIWNPRDEDEVTNARRTFDELVGEKRFAAFRVRERGARGEQVTEFDPDAEKLIIVPPMAGG